MVSPLSQAPGQDIYASPARYLELICHLSCYSPLMMLIRYQSEADGDSLAAAVARHYADSSLVLPLVAEDLQKTRTLIGQLAGALGVTKLPVDEVVAREVLLEQARIRAETADPLLVIVSRAERLPAEMLLALSQFALMSSHAISFCLFGREGFDDGLKEGPASASMYRISLLASEGAPEPEAAMQAVADTNSGVQQSSVKSPKPAESVALPKRAEPSRPAEPEPSRPVEPVATSKREPGFTTKSDFADLQLDGIDLSSTSSRSSAPSSSSSRRFDWRLPNLSQLDTNALLSQLRSPLALAFMAAILLIFIVIGLLSGGDEDSAVATTVLQVPMPPVIARPEADLAAMPAEDLPVPSQASRNPTNSSSQSAVAGRADTSAVVSTPATPAAAVSAPQAPVEKASVSRLSGYPAWFAKDNAWAVQLLGTSEQQGARDFVTKWQSGADGKLVWYRSQRNGQPWYVVIAGAFSSREDAAAWVKKRPAGLKTDSPWIREMSQISPSVEPR
ncbi:SPOR domain-containing protein [Oceanobacter sp. 5_MG-2023]|uniref:SPOR domain-containing protein n=1 Tax=Oceanobacter sp. 5_MG-2023 TaxID=3062645 RepID=UPI0026E493B2|nr:SPOR domain-containing protein [Oceanobacter sp. 5_MG-2023]MDO6682849.1 SPOR domain-containing protein [Oceanobacter sp. 5_MG-2023]